MNRRALLCLLLLSACKPRTNTAEVLSESEPQPAQDYHSTIATFLQDQKVAEGWDWFMYRSHGIRGYPMVLLKMLPELDPEIWGKPEEKFARFGHFVLPGDEERALPSSLGMASFPTRSAPHPVIVTTETCGTCHMGRVRLPNGETIFVYGGVNTQVDMRKWRTALEKTVEKYLSSRASKRATAERLRGLVASKPPGFFLADLDEDSRQRRLLTERGGAERMLDEFIDFTDDFIDGKKRQRTTSYRTQANSVSPNIDEGNPGQLDASGDLLAQRLPTSIGMPDHASMTDIPVVWKQSEHAIGQWDGTVGSQYIRNLAAQVAVLPGKYVDRRIAHYALQFVTDLPAPPFPFAKAENHEALVAKGSQLFANNCADCHKPLNDKTYALGLDMNRATIMTRAGTLLIGKTFYDACHADLPDGTSPPSCGNFAQYLRGADPITGPGYAAKTLTGIWARAPYLHNGSVPTLRHLLLPATRPERFGLGSLGYDAVNGGFNWEIAKLAEYQSADPLVGVLDTKMDSLSNKGHDQKSLSVDGKTYRLDWTPQPGDDPEAVDALLEYLKTL